MKRIFGKRFWKYFIIIFLVTAFVNFAYIMATYSPNFYPLSVDQGLYFALLGTLLALPSALCMATSVAIFAAFRSANFSGTTDFVKTFSLTAGCFLVLAGGIYVYNSTLRPTLNLKSAKLYWQMKTGSFYPESIEDRGASVFSNPDFENTMPSTFSYQKLHFKIDSLSDAQKGHIQESNRLLNQLPKDLADEAYESYNLELLRVEYGHSSTTELSADSIFYIQRYTLYEEAQSLANSYAELARYEIENYKRWVDPVSLFLTFFIFALAGYCSRNKSMNKIFGILAIIIVAVAMLLSVTRYTESVVLDMKRQAREYGSRTIR